MKTQILFITFFICISSFTFAQNTIHVPDDYATIQEGIDAATSGDTVIVDQGIYTENINYYSKAITVTSHYINTLDSADIYNTIIDGSEPHNPDMASVVRISGPDTNAVICGFTIQNGTGSLVQFRHGGGILCTFGGKIIHNRIIDNSVLVNEDEHALGGGIAAEGTSSSHFIIKNNIIENNQMVNELSNTACWGSGIFINTGSIIVENNIIRSNSATGRPYGVGMEIEYCQGVIRNNIITLNNGSHTLSNRSRGGGMYLVNLSSDMIISNNEISQNQLIHNGLSSEFGGGIGIYNTGGFENNCILIEKNIISENDAMYGGGISISRMNNIQLFNNVIRTNNTEKFGGGIFFDYVDEKRENIKHECHATSENRLVKSKADFIPLLVNNTIAGNIAGSYGGGLLCGMESDYLFFNNIVFDNSAGTLGNEIYQYNATNLLLYYNNINTDEISGNGTWEGEENINVDPCFCFDGYHLMAESGCINTGIESLEVNGTEYFAPEYDIDNDPRPLDNYVDIGADEVMITDITEIAGQYKNFRLIGFPNPFTSETTIRYELQKPSAVRLSITSQFGGQIKVLLHDDQFQGKHELQVDLSDLGPGVYFCTLKTGEGVQTKKLIKLE